MLVFGRRWSPPTRSWFTTPINNFGVYIYIHMYIIYHQISSIFIIQVVIGDQQVSSQHPSTSKIIPVFQTQSSHHYLVIISQQFSKHRFPSIFLQNHFSQRGTPPVWYIDSDAQGATNFIRYSLRGSECFSRRASVLRAWEPRLGWKASIVIGSVKAGISGWVLQFYMVIFDG